jgi:hypothetical protein
MTMSEVREAIRVHNTITSRNGNTEAGLRMTACPDMIDSMKMKNQ